MAFWIAAGMPVPPLPSPPLPGCRGRLRHLIVRYLAHLAAPTCGQAREHGTCVTSPGLGINVVPPAMHDHQRLLHKVIRRMPITA